MFLLPQSSQSAYFAHPLLSLSRLSYIKSFCLPPILQPCAVIYFSQYLSFTLITYLTYLFQVSSQSLPSGLEPLPWWGAGSTAHCMTEAYSSVSIRKVLIHSLPWDSVIEPGPSFLWKSIRELENSLRCPWEWQTQCEFCDVCLGGRWILQLPETLIVWSL